MCKPLRSDDHPGCSESEKEQAVILYKKAATSGECATAESARNALKKLGQEDKKRPKLIKKMGAIKFAIDIDKGPSEDTRQAAISEGNGYLYARDVDHGYHPKTMKAAIKEGNAHLYARDTVIEMLIEEDEDKTHLGARKLYASSYADRLICTQLLKAAIAEGNGYKYARDLAKRIPIEEEKDDARRAAYKEGFKMEYSFFVSSKCALSDCSERLEDIFLVKTPNETDQAKYISLGKGYLYAFHVDRCPHPKTRRAAIQEGLGFEYAFFVDRAPREDTRKAAIKDKLGYEYALFIDRAPREDTRRAAIEENKSLGYIYNIAQKPHPETIYAAFDGKDDAAHYEFEISHPRTDDKRLEELVCALNSGSRLVESEQIRLFNLMLKRSDISIEVSEQVKISLLLLL